MRRPLLLASLLSLALATAACRQSEPTTAIRPQGIVPAGADTVEDAGSQPVILRMSQRWTAARDGRDYDFRTSRGCFCVEEVRREVIVSVSGARVTAVRDAATGAARDPAQFYTIEELFARATGAAHDRQPVTGAYHGGAGYPISLTIGTLANDAGVTYEVHEVRLP